MIWSKSRNLFSVFILMVTQADHHNKVALSTLAGEEIHFRGIDLIWHSKLDLWLVKNEELPDGLNAFEQRDVEDLRNGVFYENVIAPDDLELKIGAKVLLLRNLDLKSEKRLCNGSQGVCIGYADEHQITMKKEKDMQDIRNYLEKKGCVQLPPDPLDHPLSGASKWPGRPHEDEQEKEAWDVLLDIYSKIVDHWLKKNANRVPVVSQKTMPHLMANGWYLTLSISSVCLCLCFPSGHVTGTIPKWSRRSHFAESFLRQDAWLWSVSSDSTTTATWLCNNDS